MIDQELDGTWGFNADWNYVDTPIGGTDSSGVELPWDKPAAGAPASTRFYWPVAGRTRTAK